MKTVDFVEVEVKGNFWERAQKKPSNARCGDWHQYRTKYVQSLLNLKRSEESFNLLSSRLLLKWLADHEQKQYVPNYVQGV